jgi:hypothetical protein
MSTKGIIDRCLPWCPGWNRDSGHKNLLKVFEQCLDIVYDFDDESMIYRGLDNKGFPPYLLTTTGTYRYDIKADNLSCGSIARSIGGITATFMARKVKRVFVDISAGHAGIEQQWVGEPYYYSVNPFSSINSRIFMQEVKGNSQPAYENTPAYFEFLEDPATTTERYFVEFYIGPPRMLSQSIQAPIPIGFEPAVECYIRGYVKRLESGQTNNDEEKFESYWLPKWQNMLLGCANMADTKTPLRIC